MCTVRIIHQQRDIIPTAGRLKCRGYPPAPRNNQGWSHILPRYCPPPGAGQPPHLPDVPGLPDAARHPAAGEPIPAPDPAEPSPAPHCGAGPCPARIFRLPGGLSRLARRSIARIHNVQPPAEKKVWAVPSTCAASCSIRISIARRLQTDYRYPAVPSRPAKANPAGICLPGLYAQGCGMKPSPFFGGRQALDKAVLLVAYPSPFEQSVQNHAKIPAKVFCSFFKIRYPFLKSYDILFKTRLYHLWKNNLFFMDLLTRISIPTIFSFLEKARPKILGRAFSIFSSRHDVPSNK